MACKGCKKDETQCNCRKDSTSGGHVTTARVVPQSSIKPPDLFVKKEDLALYERKLTRWSRKSGIDLKDQGDIILMHPSNTNPTLHDRLENEIGDLVSDNEEGVKLIISTLKKWYGVNKGVDLMRVFNEFVNTVRKTNQDLHSYVADFEAKNNQLEKLGERLSARLLALFLLKNANLSDTEFQIVTSNLDFSSDDKEKVGALYIDTKEALNKHQNCKVINERKNCEEKHSC